MTYSPDNIHRFLYTPGKYLLIPEFQRPYSWEADNIRTFLEDLESLSRTDKKHYFGSVVFINDADDPNARAIIDGQQRVTTTLLMLMAIYHIESREGGDKILAGTIQEQFLYNKSEYSKEKNRIKLKAVTSDDTVFTKLYNQTPLDAKQKQSRLYQAYNQFVEYFSGKTGLATYVNTLERFEIFTLSLDANDDNPQRVFESINSTGKPLTDGDKIRNFALMLNGKDNRTHVIKTYWQNIEAPLTDANKDYITDFFRSYIIAERQAVIPLGSVYPQFKKLFSKRITPEQAREDLDAFYSDILAALEYYRLTKFGDDDNDRFRGLRQFFFNLRYVQIELYIPFAMSVLKHYDQGGLTPDELVKVFKQLESYFARRIVCNTPTTSVDKMLASLHKDILAYQAADAEASYLDVMTYILTSRSGATKFPTDQDIFTAIQSNQTYHQRKTHVNYILASVDDQSKESSLLKQMHDKERKLSIEHIMPQKLTPEWIEELQPNPTEVHEKYLHTLANLTLTGYNPEYSNRDFNAKKTMENGFNASPLAINKPISEATQWNEVMLRARQKWWLEKLRAIWPMLATAFKPVEVDTRVSLLDNIDLTGTKIRTVHIQDEIVPVTSWAEALDSIVEHMFDLDENLYEKAVQDEFLARYLRADETALINPSEIYDSGYFIETGTNTNYKRMIVAKLCPIVGWSRGDITVELAEPVPADDGADVSDSDEEFEE